MLFVDVLTREQTERVEIADNEKCESSLDVNVECECSSWSFKLMQFLTFSFDNF